MKVTLAGEVFEYDGARKPMSEALAIEKAWGRRYAEWETELAAGSAEALCVLAWVIWRRDGRDIPLSAILDGTADFDFGEFITSLAAAAETETAAGGDGAGPTIPAGSPDPAGTATTPPATPGRSRKSSM
jgi:hypothetical protein